MLNEGDLSSSVDDLERQLDDERFQSTQDHEDEILIHDCDDRLCTCR